MMAREMAQKRGWKLRDCWLDPVPASTMRETCCSVIGIIWSGDSHVFWRRLSESAIEQRFGRLRSSFSTAQMAVADYWRSSFALMKAELKKYQDGPVPEQKMLEKQLLPDDFCCIASRAFCGAVKLATLCSNKTRAELQSAFNLSFSETGGEPWEDDAGQGLFVPFSLIKLKILKVF